jgi:hypothetical protein
VSVRMFMLGRFDFDVRTSISSISVRHVERLRQSERCISFH